LTGWNGCDIEPPRSLVCISSTSLPGCLIRFSGVSDARDSSTANQTEIKPKPSIKIGKRVYHGRLSACSPPPSPQYTSVDATTTFPLDASSQLFATKDSSHNNERRERKRKRRNDDYDCGAHVSHPQGSKPLKASSAAAAAGRVPLDCNLTQRRARNNAHCRSPPPRNATSASNLLGVSQHTVRRRNFTQRSRRR
jgi:hypothetical protein